MLAASDQSGNTKQLSETDVFVLRVRNLFPSLFDQLTMQLKLVLGFHSSKMMSLTRKEFLDKMVLLSCLLHLDRCMH